MQLREHVRRRARRGLKRVRNLAEAMTREGVGSAFLFPTDKFLPVAAIAAFF